MNMLSKYVHYIGEGFLRTSSDPLEHLLGGARETHAKLRLQQLSSGPVSELTDALPLN